VTDNKTSVVSIPAAVAMDCSISGVWWCTPPTLYAAIEPITFLASSESLAFRPAPEVPDAATTTTSVVSMAPARASGASASATAVG